MHPFFTWPHIVIVMVVIVLFLIAVNLATGGGFFEFFMMEDIFELIGELLSAW